MSGLWFTSDLHLGHRLVADLRGYAGAETHDADLAQRWDAAIRADDTVWVLGDISSGTKAAQHAAIEWFKQRPGAKHLIAGNHDGCHPMHRDAHKWQPLYLEAFISVQMAARRRVVDGVSVLLSHLPYAADHTAVPRYAQWRLPDLGMFLLHGHTHTEQRFSGREIHVGVDAWGLAPVPMDDIASYIRGFNQGVGPHEYDGRWVKSEVEL